MPEGHCAFPMVITTRFLVCIGLLAAVCPAQMLEVGVHGGQHQFFRAALGSSASRPGAPNEYSLDGGFRLGFRMTTNSDTHWGHEFGYAYNRTQLVFDPTGQRQGMATHQGMYNFLAYATREGARVRPFGTGGAHFSNFVQPGASATQGGGSTKFGVNYGGGLKIRVHPMFLIRFDLRRYETPKPYSLFNRSGWIRQMEYSAGFSFFL
jgi:hypothetical protein